MFPNAKPSLQKETNGSYSFAVIGILVFSALVIFVGSTMGVIAFEDLSENSNESALPIGTEPLSTLECNKPEDILDKVINDEPGCLDEPLDQIVYNPEEYYAEEGSIEWVDDSFESDLPICMSVEYGMEQWVVIKVKGGYKPDLKNYFGYSAYGLMYLKDACGNIVYNDCEPGMFAGWLLDSYTELPCVPGECCWTYYNFTLNPELCMNWVCLESSYEVGGQLCENKFYTFEYDTHWKGCEFDKILAHVNRVPGIPYSR